MKYLAITLGSLVLVACAERLFPRRCPESPIWPRRFANLAIWIINIVLAGFVFASPAVLRPQLDAAFGLGLPSWPITEGSVSFVAAFLLLDVLRYAVHRCEHAVPFLWRFHAMHHSDPEVDVTTSVRHHPVELLMAASVYWLATLVLDIPASAVFAHSMTVFAASAITHGNIRVPEQFQRCLELAVITVDLHLIHHSVSYGEANSNFGAVFSFWDRLFGTYRWLYRTQQQDIVFGISDLPRRDSTRISAMFLSPWLVGRAVPGPRT